MNATTSAKNLSALLLTQLATWALTLVVLVLTPHYLGVDDFGMLSFATAYLQFFSLAALLGTSTLLTKLVARDPSIAGLYTYNALVMKLVVVAVVVAVALGFGLLVSIDSEPLVLIAIGCVGMLFTVQTDVLTGTLSGLHRMARPALFATIGVYVANGIGLLVLIAGGGVVALAITMAAASTLPFIGNLSLLRHDIRANRVIDMRIWRVIFAGGIPLLLLAFFNTIYGTIDIPILQGISGDEQVGLYALAYRWVGIPIFITTAVVTVFFPRFSESYVDPAGFADRVNRAIKLVMWVSIPAAIGLGVLANEIIDLLYEPEFAETSTLIQILAVHIPLAGVDTVLASALIAAERLRPYLVVAAVAAVINPIACVVLINAFQDEGKGAVGASIAAVATELVVSIGAFRLRTPGTFDRHTSWNCAKTVGAGAIMGVVVFLGRGLPLAVVVVIGIATYAVAALALRVVTVQEVGDIKRQLTASRRQTADVE